MGARLFAGVVLGLVLAASSAARADDGDIYVYKQRGGAKLFTDQKKPRSGYVYLGKYGRAPAFSSCSGMTPELLKARSDSYADLVVRHAAAYGIPVALINAVMHVESCFDRHAVSRAGAQGLMQLMPDTADLLGVKDSFDAGQNIEGGTHYLSMMRQRFPSDWKLVLAAYNAGPEAVDKYGTIPPYPETRNYVQRVMGLYQKSATATATRTSAPGE